MTSATSRFSWAVRRKSPMSVLQQGQGLGTLRTRIARPSCPPAAAAGKAGSKNCSRHNVVIAGLVGLASFVWGSSNKRLLLL